MFSNSSPVVTMVVYTTPTGGYTLRLDSPATSPLVSRERGTVAAIEVKSFCLLGEDVTAANTVDVCESVFRDRAAGGLSKVAQSGEAATMARGGSATSGVLAFLMSMYVESCASV